MNNNDQSTRQIAYLTEFERKILWLASWTIHNANHLRDSADGLKVGGHQASSASLVSVMTALYLAVLRPQDRVAVKPHASPVFHAIQYLLGNQTLEKLQHFRAFGGAQSYPSRTKDIDDVDFSTGSVGLGAAVTIFASLAQDYIRAHQWSGAQAAQQEGRMIALIGDAELDEGNIFEALLEGWKNGLRNTWWVIDYNRQSLDAVVREGLHARFAEIFRSLGWDVVTLKYGALLEAAFREPGGPALRDWIDACPNQLYSALTFQGGGAWRKRLQADLAGKAETLQLIERLSDAELARLMTNLGGHDLPSLLQAFNGIDHDRPVVFFCYTIKGHGLPLAGHKDNHSGLMNPDQMETLRAEMQVPQGQEWDKFAGLALAPAELQRFLDAVPFNALGARRYRAPVIAVPDVLAVEAPKTASTQQGFGGLLNEIARNDTALASRIVTTSPDVTVSTNLGPWVNRCGLFARHSLADTFRSERIASAQKWEASPQGQHIELGIAEMNLFLNLAALGLSHSLFGERLLPVGTLYDPFPADYCERNWLRDETGGSVYLRLSTRQLEQPGRAMTPPLRQGIIDGAYWLREPGPNCEVVIAYTGAVAPEAIDAVGLMAEDRRDIGLLAITSADRLEAGWHAAERARQRGNTAARSHIERLLAPLAGDCGIVTVLDGHPATLAWLGGVHGHRVKALGVEHFGQTGTIQDLYRHHGLDTRSIISAAQAIAPQRTMRRYVALG